MDIKKQALLARFKQHLIRDEKSTATVEKYLRDVRRFLSFLSDFSEKELTKEQTMAYKEYLWSQYAPASVNSMLTAMNLFLRFMGKEHLCVKLLKIQRQIFCREEKELSKEEYHRLVKASEGTRLSYIIQTICGTGIRVSELRYITVEAVNMGKATVNCKNKTRMIFIPRSVQKLLREYMKKAGVKTGSVFVTKNGKPLNRSNIWRDMQTLCKKANVSEKKVFPHNLRHLFARLFYSIDKDLVRLADLLGHASINTTRIYTIETGEKHRIGLERVQKILTTSFRLCRHLNNYITKKGCTYRKNTNFCAYILKYSAQQGVQISAGKFLYVSGFLFVGQNSLIFAKF